MEKQREDGGDIITTNEKSLSLYGNYESLHNNFNFVSFWGLTIGALVISSIFLFNGSLYWTSVLALGLFSGSSIATFGLLHSSSSQVILRDNDMAIYRKSGLKKIVKIEDIKDISTLREAQTWFAQTKKKRGTYYVLFFRLNNGKSVMLSGIIHITTLIKFLREFSKYYKEKLPEQCISHIQEFIKEKEHILKRFEEVGEDAWKFELHPTGNFKIVEVDR
jgi:hypothetical protein